MIRLKITPILFALSLLVFACGETDEDEDETAESGTSTTTTTTTTTAGTDTKTAGAISIISTVESNMVPNSLALSTTALNLQDDGNPCAQADDFFDCQPNLLKLYLSIGQTFVGIAETLLSNVGEITSQVSSGSGELDLSGEEGMDSLQYNITSEEIFTIQLNSTTGPFLYLSVDESVTPATIAFKFDAANDPEADADDSTAVNAEISFTDSDNFEIDLLMVGEACDPEDVRAPSNIAISIAKSAGAWKGKANLYMPRWLVAGEPTCNDTPTDNTKLFMYHDFAGNATNTTASLYMADVNLMEKGAYDTYSIQNFCTNYPNLCFAGRSLGSTAVIADTYVNPFCVTSTTSTWGGACSDIPVTEYSSSEYWLLPAEMEAATVTFPASL